MPTERSAFFTSPKDFNILTVRSACLSRLKILTYLLWGQHFYLGWWNRFQRGCWSWNSVTCDLECGVRNSFECCQLVFRDGCKLGNISSLLPGRGTSLGEVVYHALYDVPGLVEEMFRAYKILLMQSDHVQRWTISSTVILVVWYLSAIVFNCEC